MFQTPQYDIDSSNRYISKIVEIALKLVLIPVCISAFILDVVWIFVGVIPSLYMSAYTVGYLMSFNTLGTVLAFVLVPTYWVLVHYILAIIHVGIEKKFK